MASSDFADTGWLDAVWPIHPFARVIVDNDFAGDPDDMFQLAHHLLSPEVDVVAVICSHLREGDRHCPTNSMEVGYKRAARLADIVRFDNKKALKKGAPGALSHRDVPIPSEATQAIIDAALDPNAQGPLYVTCGGGLTDIASAYLLRPEIASHLTLIWIGGPEYPGLAYPPPGSGNTEYNLAIDPIAAQVVFNDSDIRIWQVPRNVYRQCMVSRAELRRRLSTCGELGHYLLNELAGIAASIDEAGDRSWCPSTYVIGDQPLVLLTALQSFFEPDPASSDYVIRPVPLLDGEGNPTPNADGRPARVYTRVDTRLMFEDMFTKFETVQHAK